MLGRGLRTRQTPALHDGAGRRRRAVGRALHPRGRWHHRRLATQLPPGPVLHDSPCLKQAGVHHLPNFIEKADYEGTALGLGIAVHRRPASLQLVSTNRKDPLK